MNETDRYTVKQLAQIAGVSVRTLHYYDQFGLLKPRSVGNNRYRYYGETELLRLQQIRFFRELSFSLEEIKSILTNPKFDILRTLEVHKATLELRAERLLDLVHTVDNTIASLKGSKIMEDKEYFNGFSDEKQAEYQKYAEDHWDKKLVQQSAKRWGALSKAGREALLAEGGQITTEIVKAIPLGHDSIEVQGLVGDWHAYINKFYDCSFEILLGLGKAYTEHPDFITFYRKIHPDMPEFLYEAIKTYCSAHGIIEE